MHNKNLSWFFLLVLACIWGSSFILMKKGMFGENESPLLSAGQVAALRIFIAATVLIPITIKYLSSIKKKDIIFFVMVGAFGNFIPAFLFTHAEKQLSSSFTGILNSLVPIFSVIVSAILFNHLIKKRALWGVLIGFVGTVLLILFKEGDISKFAIVPTLMVVFATFCYAISLNVIKEKLDHIHSVAIAAISLFFMIPGAIIMLVLDDKPIESIFYPQHLEALGYTSVLAIFGTSIALVMFNNLIKMSSTAFASSVTYLIPVVAIIWGVIFGESMSWSMVFISVILTGIYLVRTSE